MAFEDGAEHSVARPEVIVQRAAIALAGTAGDVDQRGPVDAVLGDARAASSTSLSSVPEASNGIARSYGRTETTLLWGGPSCARRRGSGRVDPQRDAVGGARRVLRYEAHGRRPVEHGTARGQSDDVGLDRRRGVDDQAVPTRLDRRVEQRDLRPGCGVGPCSTAADIDHKRAAVVDRFDGDRVGPAVVGHRQQIGESEPADGGGQVARSSTGMLIPLC